MAATVPPIESWREPTRRLPLAWGGWAARSVLGLSVLGAGAALLTVVLEVVSPTSSAAAVLRLSGAGLGVALGVVGWAVLPARPTRRALVAGPAALAPLAVAAGPWGLIAAAVPLLAWLIVRERPLQTLATATIPIAATIVVARIESRADPLLPAWADALLVLAAVVAAAAVARTVHVARDRRRAHLARWRADRAR